MGNVQITVSLIAAAVAVTLYSQQHHPSKETQQNHPESSEDSSGPRVVQPWPVIEGTWNSSNPDFVKYLVKQRVPVVFRRDLLDNPHPATRWAPLRKWSPYSMWAKSLKEQTLLPNVRVSKGHSPNPAGLESHVFKLATNRSGPLMSWAVDQASLGYSDDEDILMHKVLDECCGFRLDRKTTAADCAASTTLDPPRNRHLYFTSLVETIGSLDSTTVGVKEVEEALHVDTKFFAEERLGFQEMPSSSTLWLGCSGVKAQTHYDKSHNFFIQIVGSKTWTLWSPEYWRQLRIHSAFHPFDRQAQQQWTLRADESSGSNPLFLSNPYAQNFPAGVRPWRVTLNEGDLLYIPPYWAHGVESDTLAAGVSILSASEEEMILAKLKSWADTFMAEFVQQTEDAAESASEAESAEDKASSSSSLSGQRASLIAHAIGSAIRGIISNTVSSSEGVNGYLDELFVSRFEDEAAVLSERGTIPFKTCTSEAKDEFATMCAPCNDEDDDPNFASAHVGFVNASTQLLTRAAVPVGAADLMIADLAEYLVNAAFGPENIVPFFSTCLRPASSPESPTH